jgi:hypothetical protein
MAIEEKREVDENGVILARPRDGEITAAKTLGNTDINAAKTNVKDIVVYGDGDLFQLISKASSEAEGWMKSTKGMQTPQGVVVQVTTQQRNLDGSYAIAEALTFVPGAVIGEDADSGNRMLFDRADTLAPLG